MPPEPKTPRSSENVSDTQVVPTADRRDPEHAGRALLVYSNDVVSLLRLALGASLVVGRKFPADFLIEDSGVSRQHARFKHDDQGLLVEDLGSRNGTRVKGEQVQQARLIRGDEVELGGARILIVDGSPDPAPGGVPEAPDARSLSLVNLEPVGAPLAAKSSAMLETIELARRVATFDVPCLIQGETGSGKEVAARLIHEASARRKRPLVVVNCAAIPDSLAESTLFGHERGAFTGATARALGAFERADGGTLFLDEVGELSPSAQADLLRVLETKTFSRVGSAMEVRVDVRVLAATHRDLETMIAEGTFRRDLFYRLNTVVIEVAPLRRRTSDIEPLAELFLTEIEKKHGQRRTLSDDARACLRGYDWPGNVRELKNVIERAAVLCRSTQIDPQDLPEFVSNPSAVHVQRSLATLPPPEAALALKDRVRDFEAQLIREALEGASGDRTLTAEMLGIPLRTLNHKIKLLGVR
jgi:two-component system, NtrC family, response regulator AtoC